MKLLFDTHIVLAVVGETTLQLPATHQSVILSSAADVWCSVASLWEIAIKVGVGKLKLRSRLENLVDTCRSFNLDILGIEPRHVLHDLVPLPSTRDPFDRLLLAQASVESMRLVTLDRALVGHPLVWVP